MKKLIELALKNRRAVSVFVFSLVILGILGLTLIPINVLPVYGQPAVQVITFYNGMPAEVMANAITNRMERWTGTATGMKRQESRTIMGASIIRNYFRPGVDPNGALTQVNSLALAEIPNLPPGTLPPIVLPYNPTATVPACIIAVDSAEHGESTLYDVARYEVRNMIMASQGANAPVVFGGKIRAVLAYLDPIKLQARDLSPVDALHALEKYNLFLPAGDVRIGDKDYAIDSNAMYDVIERMKSMPLRIKRNGADYLGDVGDPKDAYLIQMNAVRMMRGEGAEKNQKGQSKSAQEQQKDKSTKGHRMVYIPVFRQHGASTLRVVEDLRSRLPDMPAKLTRTNIDLELVMDQSIYVWQSIKSLATEGILGAVLCSLVILLFLGQWRMTVIAGLTIPIAILTAVFGLYATGNSLNVMTLGGMALAIGPLVDTAIIALENTERHMRMGDPLYVAAREGSREIALPALVAVGATLLVLAPLALMPSAEQFLFGPLATAVAFSMVTAYILCWSFVPVCCATFLKGKSGKGEEEDASEEQEQTEDAEENADGQGNDESEKNEYKGFFGYIQRFIDAATRWYDRRLGFVMKHRLLTVGIAVVLLIITVIGLGPILRREFFPEVDSGAFEMYVRAQTGTRLESTEKRIAEVEQFVRKSIGKDLKLVISELGVRADWSAAYTPNAGPMDALMKIQLTEDRRHSTQYHAQELRKTLAEEKRFGTLEFTFSTGGTIRTALNQGNVTPINIRVQAKDLDKAYELALYMKDAIADVDGVVDARIRQRLDYPEYFIDVDRDKARDLGLSVDNVMKNVIAALKSSIQFNKRNFWIDPVSQNQYFVGVQYPEEAIESLDTVLNVSMISPFPSTEEPAQSADMVNGGSILQKRQPIPLSNLVKIKRKTISAEVTHNNLQSSIDVTMNVRGRDLGHVADDVSTVLSNFGQPQGSGKWKPYDPTSSEGEFLEGGLVTMSGEYQRMQSMFYDFGVGLILAIIFVYFLMVTLLDSYLVPLIVMSSVPVGLVGVIPMLYLTGSALNIQSLLGVIFMVGIVVSNTVLLTDFAKRIRDSEGLNPTDAVHKAAVIRARPVVMTALAAFFALIPMSLALEQGSEANAPLGRAVIGGIWAGLITTLVIVPALYSLVVPDDTTAKAAESE